MTAPTRTQLQARLRELEALRSRVAAEILTTSAALVAHQPGDQTIRHRRPHGLRPPCSTEQGYQWHRYQARKHDAPWPLPVEDPCGCRAAHRQHWRRWEEARQDQGATA